MLLFITVLLILTIYLVLYQYRYKLGWNDVELPDHLFEENEIEINILKEKDGRGAFGLGWAPLTRRLRKLEGYIKASGLRRRIVKAGSPMGIFEFLTFKLLSTILIPVLAYTFLNTYFPHVPLLTISVFLGFVIPDIWLNSKIKRRQFNIRRDLPNIIDLLTLCVGGGMDFMLAVNRVVTDMKKCDLTQELSEVYRETQMGKSRREALKNFAWRVDTAETHSFARTLVQADRMGSPMADALRLQSEEIRVRRFQRGEAMALKAPIKLLFPLFAFILPVVLVIVGAPIILQFTRGSLNVGF